MSFTCQSSVRRSSTSRPSPVAIGLQTSATPSTSVRASEENDMMNDEEILYERNEPIDYDATIMHRAVPPTLYDMYVRYNATALDIGAEFNIPSAYVSAHWITSKTPVIYPTNFVTWTTNNREDSQNSTQDQDNSNSGPYTPSSSVSRFRSLDNVVRRAPLSPAQLAAYRDLARALQRKLLAHLSDENEDAEAGMDISIQHANGNATVTKKDEPSESEDADLSSSGDLLVFEAMKDRHAAKPPSRRFNSVAPAGQTRTQYENTSTTSCRASCGFATLGTHADLSLSPSRSSVQKRAKGLYRVARSASTSIWSLGMYAEVDVIDSGGPGGLCIGLTTSDARLDRVIGDSLGSIGLHASGSIVASKKWTALANAQFCTGDTVSVHIVPVGASPFSDADTDSDADLSNSLDNNAVSADPFSSVRVDFAINGRIVHRAPLQTNPTDGPLHIGVSLYRMDSKVVLNCCPSSWKFASHLLNSHTPLTSLCSNTASALASSGRPQRPSAKSCVDNTATSSISELTP